jgi:hypothetical protein
MIAVSKLAPMFCGCGPGKMGTRSHSSGYLTRSWVTGEISERTASYPKVSNTSAREGLLRLADFCEPRLQLGYLFCLDSELLTTIETMYVVYILEPTHGHPEHCAALGVLALKRYLLFFHNDEPTYQELAGSIPSTSGFPCTVCIPELRCHREQYLSIPL